MARFTMLSTIRWSFSSEDASVWKPLVSLLNRFRRKNLVRCWPQDYLFMQGNPTLVEVLFNAKETFPVCLAHALSARDAGCRTADAFANGF
jgi:hypothetical protein